MASPRWTPADFKKHGWTAERALAVARRLDPEASDEHYLRASVSNPTKKVANKTELKRLFTERKIPFEFDVFSAKMASFVKDGDVTGVLYAPSLPAGYSCRACFFVFGVEHQTGTVPVRTWYALPAPAPNPCASAGSTGRPRNSLALARDWTRARGAPACWHLRKIVA